MTACGCKESLELSHVHWLQFQCFTGFAGDLYAGLFRNGAYDGPGFLKIKTGGLLTPFFTQLKCSI